MQHQVFVLSKDGKPLMPTKRFGKVRRLLKEEKAKVASGQSTHFRPFKREPFTIQLLIVICVFRHACYETTEFTQPVTLGIDSGYEHIGFSAVTEKEELIAGEVEMLSGMFASLTDAFGLQAERNEQRRMYRRNRRNRLRHRKPRFDNRKKENGWLAPSIQHKLLTHVRLMVICGDKPACVGQIKSILPITNIVVEAANFDIQKIKNPDIFGTEYQQGEQKGFSNTREYVLHRDGHQCQNPDCFGKTDILHVHHIDMNRTNNHLCLVLTPIPKVLLI